MTYLHVCLDCSTIRVQCACECTEDKTSQNMVHHAEAQLEMFCPTSGTNLWLGDVIFLKWSFHLTCNSDFWCVTSLTASWAKSRGDFNLAFCRMWRLCWAAAMRFGLGGGAWSGSQLVRKWTKLCWSICFMFLLRASPSFCGRKQDDCSFVHHRRSAVWKSSFKLYLTVQSKFSAQEIFFARKQPQCLD